MSTWISRLALGFGLALTACVPGEFGGMSGAATRSLQVSGGAVTVAPPQGYCIDRKASRDGAEGAFVLIGTCAALSGVRSAGPSARPAVLTASVLNGAPAEGIAGILPQMTRFFGTDAGRSALSRSGDAGAVDLIQAVSQGDTLYLRVADRSKAEAQVEPEYWRAVLALNGRMVTLSALSLERFPLGPDEKRKVLEAFVSRMRAANRA